MRHIKHALLALAVLFCTASATAATLQERSPMSQGMWWNPARPGSGFEIFSAAGQVAVFWFTFDGDGKAVWYTAQGAESTLGERWPLLRHRWQDGANIAEVVGSLGLRLRHPEAADVSFSIAGREGEWPIEPYIVSGIVNEIDHGGTWFDPTQRGWGLTLVDQGDVLGGAIFTYDASGAPTWVAGFNRGTRDVEYFRFQGSCPTCTFAPSTSVSAGRVFYEFDGDARATARSRLTLPMASGIRLDGATLVPLSRPASMRPADRQLASFHTEEALRTYLAAGMLTLTMPALGDFSASPAPTFSAPNVQEAGVDEAGLVKSDGRRVFTYDYANTMRKPALRVARVDDEGARISVLGTVPLSGGLNVPAASAGLYVHGEKLVSVHGSGATAYGMSPWSTPGAWINGLTQVEIFDLPAEGLPVSKWRADFDGFVVASRRMGDRLYLVLRYAPYVTGFNYYNPSSAPNREMLASVSLDVMMPKVRVQGQLAPLVRATEVYAPPQGARKPVANLVLVVAIDLASPRIVQSMAIAGASEALYGSPGNLFLASARYESRNSFGTLLPEPAFPVTDIHQIRAGADGLAIVGSGTVEGHLGGDADKAPFRMSEHQGRLRVVSSSGSMWGGVVRNRLSILEPSAATPGLLKTVAFLPNAARPEPLGKPNEVLYGTRFLGERLYAVTFLKIDPLYVVDLAQPADPRIVAALQVPGFSDYLHPLPNGLLLGFGKDAKPASTMGDAGFAWYQGLQVSLFDVRDAGKPRELQRLVIGKRGSDSALLRHHHAFSALLDASGFGTFAIPARIHDGDRPEFGTEDWASYPWVESGLLRFALQGTGAGDARIVPLKTLVTHRPQDGPMYSYMDATARNGRSVLFPAGTVYVGEGAFWRQDAAGNTAGPF